MRIAQVAPLHESVPPKLYGGTERVVSYLTEELVSMGHDVTLFASGDSLTSASLDAPWPRALRLDACTDERAPHTLQLERVLQRASTFDIIHYHVDTNHYPISRRIETPHVTTLHGRLDLPHLQPCYTEFCDIPVVSISHAQRDPLPQANWAGTVHHGLPPDLHRFDPGPGKYFAFLGRISPEKRLDRAIEIATRLHVPLRIAAKVDSADADYFRTRIAKLLERPGVEYLGEIGERDKSAFLGGARALLFPVDWPEPFGLVMVEAMACGTPVVATRRGAVPELIDEGVTGFCVDDLDEAVEAAARVGRIDRRGCREAFERRFTASRMARDYLGVYARTIELSRRRGPNRRATLAAE